MNKSLPNPDALAPSGPIGSVLVADDDDYIQDLLSRELTSLGYFCVTAGDGAEALQSLGAFPFDIAIIDLDMPKIDGFQLLAEISARYSTVLPIVLTGTGNVQSAVKAMNLGAYDFLEKPCDSGLLGRSVSRAMSCRWERLHGAKMHALARQWEDTFDAVPDMMAIVDTEYRILRLNKSMARRLGCSVADATGSSCRPYIPGLNEAMAEAPKPSASSNGLDNVLRFTDEHACSYYCVKTSPLSDAEGVPIGYVYQAHDITVEHEAKREIEKAHSEIERLVSSMSAFLIEVNTRHRVVRWNTAAERVFGIDASSVIGERFTTLPLQWDWSVVPQDLSVWITSLTSIRLPEIRYTRPDGSEGVLGVTVNPTKTDCSDESGFFLMGADITERLLLESQLVQAQKLESIGQLAAGIAHEINTPTQYVGDNIEFLQMVFADFERLRKAFTELFEAANAGKLNESLLQRTSEVIGSVDVEYLVEQTPRALQQSLEGIGRIGSIVGAMKEFSHPGTEEKTFVDLNRSIESAATVSRNEWKYVADLETDLDPDLPQVPCLPGELNQVLLNLIVNAAHAIADVVEGRPEAKGLIKVSSRREGDWAAVRVSDTGTGIPTEVRSRVFDPFFTTKEVGRGTGQGLSIARSVVVDKHSGTLTFDTEMGRGTIFLLRVPLSVEQKT